MGEGSKSLSSFFMLYVLPLVIYLYTYLSTYQRILQFCITSYIVLIPSYPDVSCSVSHSILFSSRLILMYRVLYHILYCSHPVISCSVNSVSHRIFPLSYQLYYISVSTANVYLPYVPPTFVVEVVDFAVNVG